jgi:plastocyanin
MRRLVTLMSIVVGALFPALPGAAEEHVVSNNNMQFLVNDAKVETITIKVGDQVVFRNDDRLVHNVYSRTPGFEFDLGSLRRGTSAKHTFAKAGSVDIECAIHPHMKFKIQVQP